MVKLFQVRGIYLSGPDVSSTSASSSSGSVWVASTSEREGFASTLCREASMLVSPAARHENIVRLHGIIADEGGLVCQLVFELADQGSLDVHIRRVTAKSKTTYVLP